MIAIRLPRGALVKDPDYNHTRLFVGNLPFSATEADVRQFLTPAGRVRWVHILLAQDGRSRGFAFVQMRNNIDAQVAIFRFDGVELEGRQLTIAFARPRNQKAA